MSDEMRKIVALARPSEPRHPPPKRNPVGEIVGILKSLVQRIATLESRPITRDIISAIVDGDGNLQIAYSNGTVQNAGRVLGAAGKSFDQAQIDMLGNRLAAMDAQMDARITLLSAELDRAKECGALIANRIAALEARPLPLAGPRGEPGPAGAVGPAGERGADGNQGPKGDRGEKGIEGIAGPAGPRGEQGLSGERGEPGLSGSMGQRGESGPAGPRGEQGEIGPIGGIGPTGRDGLDGKAGLDGLHGRDGRDGLPGIAGKDGINGKDGRGLSGVALTPDGNLELAYSDGEIVDLGRVVGERGSQGDCGARGEPGKSITGVAKSETGELIIAYSDGEVQNLGSVVGPKGKDGRAGRPGSKGETIAGSRVEFGDYRSIVIAADTIAVARAIAIDGERLTLLCLEE